MSSARWTPSPGTATTGSRWATAGQGHPAPARERPAARSGRPDRAAGPTSSARSAGRWARCCRWRSSALGDQAAAAGGPLSAGQVADYLAAVCEALSEFGGAKVGDKTIVDAVASAHAAAAAAAGPGPQPGRDARRRRGRRERRSRVHRRPDRARRPGQPARRAEPRLGGRRSALVRPGPDRDRATLRTAHAGSRTMNHRPSARAEVWFVHRQRRPVRRGLAAPGRRAQRGHRGGPQRLRRDPGAGSAPCP